MKNALLCLAVLLSSGVFFSLTSYAQKNSQNLVNVFQPTASANVKLLASRGISRVRWRCSWYLKHRGGLTSRRTNKIIYRGAVYANTEELARSKANEACLDYRRTAPRTAVYVDSQCFLANCKQLSSQYRRRANPVRQVWYCNWVLQYRNTTKQGNRRYSSSSKTAAISKAKLACSKVRRDGIKAMEDYIKTIKSTTALRQTLEDLNKQKCLSPRCDFQ